VYSGHTGYYLYSILGEYTNDDFGLQAVGLDDLDGDGVPDYAVSAPMHYPNGRVYFLSGADGSIFRVLDLDNGRKFGRTMARVGDLDGDGMSDLLIGAYLFNRGTVHVVSSTGTTLAILEGDVDGDEFGMVASAGDVNGDGTDDFLVGAWARDGVVSLYSGAD